MGKPRPRVGCKKSRGSGCTGKQKFNTLEAAEKAAYRPMRMTATWGHMTAYHCKFCKQYHYGHSK